MRWMHAWLKVSTVIFRLPSCQLSPAIAFCLGCVMPAWSYPCDEEAAPAAAAAAAAANDVAEDLSKVRIYLNGVAQVPASIGNLFACHWIVNWRTNSRCMHAFNLLFGLVFLCILTMVRFQV